MFEGAYAPSIFFLMHAAYVLSDEKNILPLFFWMFPRRFATLLLMTKEPASRNPWAFLPTLYFAEGLPYVLINTVSVILYKRMGIDNAHIAFWTSWLYLPWVIKMFWGPFVDVYSTKRKWILWTQAAMSLCMFVIAFSLRTRSFFPLSLAAFLAGAFISATYDIATDGFYMLALTEKDQALFVGLRAAFYRLAMIFGIGIPRIRCRNARNIEQRYRLELVNGHDGFGT